MIRNWIWFVGLIVFATMLNPFTYVGDLPLPVLYALTFCWCLVYTGLFICLTHWRLRRD